MAYYDKRSKIHSVCRDKYRRENPERSPVKNHEGYILIYKPEHPNARKDGYMFEHRLVLEEKLGRFLLPTEIPHHINHLRNDNRPENLMLLTKQQHDLWHTSERRNETHN